MRTLLIPIMLTASVLAMAERPAVHNSPELKVLRIGNNTVTVNGGRKAGVAQGMTLTLRRTQPMNQSFGSDAEVSVTVAILMVVAVHDTTADCVVRKEFFDIEAGDIAFLPKVDLLHPGPQPRPERRAAGPETAPAEAARVPQPAAPEPPQRMTIAAPLPESASAQQAPAEAKPEAASASPANTSPVPAVVNEEATPVSAAADDDLTLADPKTTFNVKYVAEGAVYIDAGKNAGLDPGMTLTVKRLTVSADAPLKAANIATVSVVSVSNTSAVCEIKSKAADIQRGDIAIMSHEDQEKLAQAQTLGPTRKYPMVIAFSEGDPLDEEVRESVPKPPLPEINRGRGRIGVDYTFIDSSNGGTSVRTEQIGGVVRVDISRIGGTYWNLNGYWRGRLAQRAGGTQTQSVFDLVNRTYTIGATYTNPQSHWTAGIGRLYLPWATSLDTFDGGYVGFKMGPHAVTGLFAGTTPDPASFDYNPDRRTAGAFVAFDGGSFDQAHFTSTEGFAVSGTGWDINRQYFFTENGIYYKRYFSIYHSMQVDSLKLPDGSRMQGLSRSFATLRLQPYSRLSLDVNHTYFRDVPTANGILVATGLLDKFLFQGISFGSRVELPRHISVYNNFGVSNRSGDSRNSFNQLYGVTFGRIWKTGFRADARYSRFNSSFGSGEYRAISLSRNLSESFRFEVNAGEQDFISALATPSRYKLLGVLMDWNAGTHYFFESGFNLQQSRSQNYQQWMTTIGYRFDTGRPR